MCAKKVEIQDFDTVTAFDPSAWPAGQDILDMLQVNHIETPHGPDYWQVCARWALLKKYDLLRGTDLLESVGARRPVEIIVNGDVVRHLFFTESEIHTIQERWQGCVRNLKNCTADTGSNDFYDFLTTHQSNHRPLRWSTMRCPSGCQFKLHAHPNLELVYCARGALHEVRLAGPPVTRAFDAATDGGGRGAVGGPDLSALGRPWYFATLAQGDWLVNEVGSVHKSFTASKGEGCLLLVLWGGSHANVAPDQEPARVNVQQAVDRMDQRLKECDCSKWETIEETFLPDSERSGA